MPTVTLSTEVFADLAAFVSAGKGVSDLAVIVFPHPLNDQPEETIRAAVAERLSVIVSALTGEE